MYIWHIRHPSHHAETSTIVSLAMDDGKEVGDGEDDVVGCGELDLVVVSWLRLP